MKIVIASGNKGKIREIAELLPSFELIGMREAGFSGEIEETGSTFFENALIKAKAVAKALMLPALADDSGLCVTALGGAPGVFSARYSGEGDLGNNLKLLQELKDVTDRRAKFCSSVALYYPDGVTLSGYGETLGEIAKKMAGNGGFGYDPLFFSYDLNKTFGEASEEEKNKVSHRFRALRAIKEQLK